MPVAHRHAYRAMEDMRWRAVAITCLEWKSDPELRVQQRLPKEAYVRAVERLFPPSKTGNEMIAYVVESWLAQWETWAGQFN